jgi:hypothetical protein
MRKYLKYFLFILTVLFMSTFNSCAKQYGCPGENASIKMDKDGNLPTRKGKSSLFDKKMIKKSKAHK